MATCHTTFLIVFCTQTFAPPTKQTTSDYQTLFPPTPKGRDKPNTFKAVTNPNGKPLTLQDKPSKRQSAVLPTTAQPIDYATLVVHDEAGNLREVTSPYESPLSPKDKPSKQPNFAPPKGPPPAGLRPIVHTPPHVAPPTLPGRSQETQTSTTATPTAKEESFTLTTKYSEPQITVSKSAISAGRLMAFQRRENALVVGKKLQEEQCETAARRINPLVRGHLSRQKHPKLKENILSLEVRSKLKAIFARADALKAHHTSEDQETYNTKMRALTNEIADLLIAHPKTRRMIEDADTDSDPADDERRTKKSITQEERARMERDQRAKLTAHLDPKPQPETIAGPTLLLKDKEPDAHEQEEEEDVDHTKETAQQTQAALKIQAQARRRKAQKIAQQLAEQKRKEKREHAAALRLQTLARKRAAQEHVKRMRDELARTEAQESRKDAASGVGTPPPKHPVTGRRNPLENAVQERVEKLYTSIHALAEEADAVQTADEITRIETEIKNLDVLYPEALDAKIPGKTKTYRDALKKHVDTLLAALALDPEDNEDDDKDPQDPPLQLDDATDDAEEDATDFKQLAAKFNEMYHDPKQRPTGHREAAAERREARRQERLAKRKQRSEPSR